ncbi:MAG: class I tRNA ligase family protein [Pseudonocardia sp.]
MLVQTLKHAEGGLDSQDIPGLPVEFRRYRIDQGERDDSNGGEHPEILFVLTGSAELSTVDGVGRTVVPGDAVLVPDGAARALTAGPGADLDYVSLTWPGGRVSADLDVLMRSLDRDRMVWSYEMHLQDLFDAQTVPGLPFGSVYGSVPPGVTSKAHCHQDGEIFLVLGGRAEVVVEERVAELRRGDVIFLPPFHTHAIRNVSDEPFDIVSVYWEDIDVAAASLARTGPQLDQPDRTLVFCPPITPNGGLHLGHLSGPYLRADLLARALRTTGRDALVITGTDDHQSFVATAAHRLGASPESVADAAGDQIRSTLAAINVDLAHFYRPTQDDELIRGIHTLFDALLTSPAVTQSVVETPWCENCAQSLYQSFAKGRCPHCQASSDGEICEACGVPSQARDLLELTCAQCGTEPVLRPESGYDLDLDKYAAPLARYYGRAHGGGQSRHLADTLVAGGLGHQYRITRQSGWGLGVPGGEADQQIIDPWVELVFTQILNTQRLTEDSRTANVTVLGFDNTFFYVVLLPAVYLALGLEHLLPWGFVSNRFLHLDGSKFSTSRRHVVWADDLLAEVPADLVRVALLRRSPEEDVHSVGAGEIANLAADPLVERTDRWLADLAAAPGEGLVPGTGAWTTHHRAFYRALCMCSEEFDHLLSVDAFSSVGYVEKLDALLTETARFRSFEQARRRISTAQEEARTSVALEYLALKVFAALVHPVMPTLGMSLWRALGLPAAPRRERNWSFIPGGTRTGLRGRTVVDLVRANGSDAKRGSA